MKTTHMGTPLTKSQLAQITVVILSVISCGCGGSGSGGGSGLTTPPSSSSLSFAPPTSFSSGGVKPGSIALADFNGDGNLDIVVSNFTSNTVAVFLNNGDGTFGEPVLSPVQIAAVGLGPLAVGDFNRDGKSDVVVCTIAGNQADIVLLGNGNGTFNQLPPIPNSYGCLHAIAVDLTGDGIKDLVAGGNGNIAVFMGIGDGTFQSPTYLPYGSAFSGPFPETAVGDFTGDNKLDIVGIDLGAVGNPNMGSLLFYAGNGDGTFQTPTAVSLPLTNPSSIVSADFNGDGKLDIMVGFLNTVVVALGNGDGTFQWGSQMIVYVTQNFVDDGTMALQTGNFMDGKPGAVVGDDYNGILTLVLNNGIGQTPPPTGTQYPFTLSSGISDIAVGDLNGDGIPDMVISNGTTNQITVILSQKQ